MPRWQASTLPFTASRETAELRAEALQMGHSLARLLADLDAFATVADYRRRLLELTAPAYPTAWSAAAAAWSVPPSQALQGYLWSWLENQVMAALKAMPLGQTAGQRVLAMLGTRIPACAHDALVMDTERLCKLDSRPRARQCRARDAILAAVPLMSAVLASAGSAHSMNR